MPKVSICIPTYNNIDEVSRLLESVEDQNYKDIEVIITDDSSDDKIETLIKEKYEYVKYQHNIKPLGHIHNWNEALSKATGEYVKIMFSDDWFTFPESLGDMVRLLEDNKDASMAFCGSMQVSKDDCYDRAASDDFLEELSKDYRYLFISNQIGAPSATIYRNDLKVAFDNKSNWASDVFLYFEILQKNGIFEYTKAPLVSIGVHENQYTESFEEKDERKYSDYRYMYEKYNLKESEKCLEHMLYSFLLPFGRNVNEAMACGIDRDRFKKEKRDYIWNEKVVCYIKAGLRKLGFESDR